ncbi:hypothetical protein K8I61_07185 [bacterium]|nr:hypothetical protein [bacterium]
MKASTYRIIIVFLAAFLLAACAPSSDDDTADADDDTDNGVLPGNNDRTSSEDDDPNVDDPADDGDDDASVADDDASLDDDALDDDVTDDDIADDDVFDDDTDNPAPDWPAVCELPRPPVDACSDAMLKLYCVNGYPVVKDDILYTQMQAIAACRDGSDPVWSDIVDCSRSLLPVPCSLFTFDFLGYAMSGFVGCLSEKGWPAERTELFDPNEWQLENDFQVHQILQALNYWVYLPLLYPGWLIEFGGATIGPGAQDIRAQYAGGGADPHYGNGEMIFYIGDAVSAQPDAIEFSMDGCWLQIPGMFGGEYSETYGSIDVKLVAVTP